MFCSACGTSNDASARFCHACGSPIAAAAGPIATPELETMRGGGAQAQVLQPPRVVGKNPVLATVLSLVIVGLGQFYNGDTKKGVVMLASAVVLGIATAGLLWVALAIWSAIDAYRVANGTGKIW